MPAAATPKPKTGVTGKGHDQPRTTRRGTSKNAAPPTEFQNEYEKTRISELSSRAQLYQLKLKKLTGELLDRKLVLIEFSAMFTSIREIILGSGLTQREKEDCLRNLADIPVVLNNVAAKQTEAETENVGTKNGHSDLD